MIIETLESVKIEIQFIRVVLPVRFGEEQMAHDAPLRTGNTWEATIDIESGKILDWEQGKTLNFYLKVVDMGFYYLLSPGKETVGSILGGYVPDCLPEEYGDYVDFEIGESGFIANWKVAANMDFSAFFASPF